MDRFRKKYAAWLLIEKIIHIELPESVCPIPPSSPVNEPSSSVSVPMGRPPIPYDDCSAKANKYKVDEELEEQPHSLIEDAAARITGEAEPAPTALYTLGISVFPSYQKVLEAKKHCYPDGVEATYGSS